jgi:hypothetical protein
VAHDVFISHSSKDKTIADAVCARLEARGIRCWIAPRDVQPGLPYGEAIIDAIHNCQMMVLLLSANANSSLHIAKEVERAVSHGATVIPLRIEAVLPAKSLDYFIGSVHWLDALTLPLDRHLDNLADTILKILPPKPAATFANVPVTESFKAAVVPSAPAPVIAPVQSPAPAPAPAKNKWLIPAMLGGAALFIALIAIVAFLFSKGGDSPRIAPGNSSGSGTTVSGAANPGGDTEPGTAGGTRSRPTGNTPMNSGLDPVVGCWHWFNNAPVAINSNGLATAGTFTAQWRLTDPVRRSYALTWPEAVDSVTLSPDGRTLTGGNQYGYQMTATRLIGGPGLPGTWRWYNAAVVVIQPGGSFFVANISGHWSGSGLSYSLTWPKPVDTLTLSGDHKRLDGHNQFGVHISGTRGGNCGAG